MKIKESRKPEFQAIVVDDVRSMRCIIVSLLNELGISCFEADSAIDAIRIIREQGDRINMLITDLEMPGKDGVSFLRDIDCALKPNFPVLMISGGGTKERISDVMAVLSASANINPFHFLIKPFTELQFYKRLSTFFPGDSADGNIVHFSRKIREKIQEAGEDRTYSDQQSQFVIEEGVDNTLKIAVHASKANPISPYSAREFRESILGYHNATTTFIVNLDKVTYEDKGDDIVRFMLKVKAYTTCEQKTVIFSGIPLYLINKIENNPTTQSYLLKNYYIIRELTGNYSITTQPAKLNAQHRDIGNDVELF